MPTGLPAWCRHPRPDIPQRRYGNARPRLPQSPAVSSERPTVVLVDDSACFLRAARQVLRLRGYEVLGEAGCAAAARVLLERCRPDVVLVDVQLGGDDGFELARELTAAHPSLPVLLMSSDATLGDPGHVRRSGARGFVPKHQLATAALPVCGVSAGA
jgi:DNA-binding NarL/FixJ family response regulator